MKTLKKILGILFNIVVFLVIIVAIILVILMLNTKKNGVANVMGFVPMSIQSQSMEPTIMTGDLIITKTVDTSILKVGDIISFFSSEKDAQGKTQTVIKTHRIVEIKETSNSTAYITKGDNNESIDENEVPPGDIISIYEGKKLSGIGRALDFLKSKWGFFCCVLLPLVAFFIYQIYHFIVVLLEEKRKASVKNN